MKYRYKNNSPVFHVVKDDKTWCKIENSSEKTASRLVESDSMPFGKKICTTCKTLKDREGVKRYQVKVGAWGAYFFDSKTGEDLNLKQVLKMLNDMEDRA